MVFESFSSEVGIDFDHCGLKKGTVCAFWSGLGYRF